jgi:TolB protein
MTTRRLSAVLLAGLLVAAARPVSTQTAIGYFEQSGDVGSPAIAGSTTYDAASQTYTITGAGTNMWGARDEFQFVWRKMTGDFILRTQAGFVGKGVDPHRKIGWIVRKSLAADSEYVDAVTHGDGLTSLQYRLTPGGPTAQVESPVKKADVIQLERRGTTYIMSVAKFGDEFTRTAKTDINLGDEVYVGLFVCSHNPKVSEQAIFTNVRIDVPPKAGWVPYRDYLGSNLEIMDVASGARKVLHTSPISLQAPNWTVDGKELLYNSEGKLWRFNLATRAVTQLDTGFAVRNNNDHVYSFDGTMLGISHHSADDNGRSVIYTLPASGGTPKRITAGSPSYFHGWSPDGKWLTYTGSRNDELDIYKISADGGDEIRLTTAEGLDDGSEYTPDGEWIYFNSTRNGMMQIWKMRPDGSQQTQITNDRHNNWFPHIAPDGKSMVVITYGQDVAPRDHPFYKHVYLRQMGLDGSHPRVIAYLYGGQGTINVPSWSPDSRQIAFVSNTALPAPH